MRISLIAICLFLITGCELFESNHNTYPTSKSDLRIINKVDEALDLEVIHNGDTLITSVAAKSDNDFEEYKVGPYQIIVKSNGAVLDTIKASEAFVEFEKPSTLYIFANSDSTTSLFLDQKKTYSDSSSYIRFINADTTYDAVDIYYAQNSIANDAEPIHPDVAYGEGNLQYNSVWAGTIAIKVTEFDNPQNVVASTTIENNATESKTILINSGEISTYIDQY